MLNIFSILPLCKGWDYKIKVWTRTLKRGESVEVERIEDMGVLLTINLITDDCYGGLNFSGQGADLNTVTISDVYPKSIYDVGALVQDPGGWAQLYYRPNPNSSAGAYYVEVLTSGFQGATFPYVPTTIVRLFLKAESTQAEAVVSGACARIIITDKKQFIRSLRAVIGMPTIQDIDPALLVAGLQEITAKGEFDKNTKEEK